MMLPLVFSNGPFWGLIACQHVINEITYMHLRDIETILVLNNVLGMQTLLDQ